MQLHSLSGHLDPKPPFSFTQSLGFIESFTPVAGEQNTQKRALIKAIMAAEQPILFKVTEAEAVRQPTLDYIMYTECPADKMLENAALDRIRFYLSLDNDLLPFYEMAEQDPPFREVVQQLYGFHQVKFATPFENACWAVLTQRMAEPAARSLKRCLVERFGSKLQLDGDGYWAFPSARQLNKAGEGEIAATINHSRKAGYLAAAAYAFSSVEEEWLRTGDYNEVHSWLRDIKGIGEWSANFVLVRGLGRMEHIEIEKNLIEAARRVYGSQIAEKDLQDIAEGFTAWQGYWALYLRTGGLAQTL